jgi:hypothetical protein
MTQQLSPAAQAVAWAYDNTPERPTGNHRYHWLAAALRAAADQVVPEEPLYGGDQRWQYERDARQESRKKLLAIADELEAR